MTNPYAVHIDFSKLEIENLLKAIMDGFKYIAPVGLGLIALVMGLFWLLRRGKKFAGAAK